VAERQVSYAPTEELDLIRSTAREFLEDRVGIPVVRELMMSETGFDRSLWKELADLGWTGLTIDEAHGGAGYGFVELSVLLEEMGRAVTPGPFFASAVVATEAIKAAATPTQQAELLPGLASGETIATLAVWERPRGWALDDVATTAAPADSAWVLSGRKRFVLDGHLADLLIVAARLPEGEVGLFVVDAGAEGVSITQAPALDPTRRLADVVLDGVAAELLGDGPGAAGLAHALRLGLVALANEEVGGAQRCLEMSVEHAKTRYQFGRPIGSFQAIKHRCAEMLVRVEQARSAAYYAARVTDDPEELEIAAPLAAALCSEAYLWVAGENIQVHGGIGFTWEHDAHLYFKRAKASTLLFGDPRHHRRRLGDALGL